MNRIAISDLDSRELDIYTKVSEVQLKRYYEPRPGVFIAESEKVIQRALLAGYEPVSFLVEESKAGHTEMLMAAGEELPVYTAKETTLKGLLGYELTGGMLCAMRRKESRSAEEILAGAKRIAVLDTVTNPTNGGAIFRSAAALGMDAVLLTKGCSDPLYRRFARVSMGTVFQIPWTYVGGGAEDWISVLKKQGFTTVALALEEKAVSIEDERLKNAERTAVVLGNEGNGLSREVVEACDYCATIPMANGVDSLNVAAASAVAFWEILH